MSSGNHMGSDRSRRQWFERMLPHIPRCGEDEELWITGRTLEAETGLSEHQRSAGINWGRLNYCPTQDWSLVSGRRGYRFCQASRQVASFIVPRLKSASTTLRVGYYGAQRPLMQHLAAHGNLTEAALRTADKHLLRALEDIRDLGGVV